MVIGVLLSLNMEPWSGLATIRNIDTLMLLNLNVLTHGLSRTDDQYDHQTEQHCINLIKLNLIQ